VNRRPDRTGAGESKNIALQHMQRMGAVIPATDETRHAHGHVDALLGLIWISVRAANSQ
jgi:hypothetical protein